MAGMIGTKEMPEWEDYVSQQLEGFGGVDRAAILSAEDGAVWAASRGYSLIEESHVVVTLDDGSEEQQQVNEATLLAEFMRSGRKPRQGLWLSGTKFMVLRSFQHDSAQLDLGKSIFTVYGKKPQGGVCITKTGQAIVLGTFDETQGHTAGLCNQIVLRTAVWLTKNGL